jgi:hypothetical protein
MRNWSKLSVVKRRLVVRVKRKTVVFGRPAMQL